MLENNWKTWVLSALLAVGVSFELIKHLQIEGNLAWAPENLHLTAETPYSIFFKKSRRPLRPQSVHFPAEVGADVKVLQQELTKFAAANKPNATDSNKKVEDPQAKKKKKDDDEFETVIDPITGKIVRRKKKTDGTVDPVAPPRQVVNLDPPPFPLPTPDGQTAAVPMPANNPDAGPPAGGAMVANPAPQSFNTLAEWERLLLGTPNTTETQTFVKDYQQHLVTSEVFYQIVAMMMADPRPAMEQLGLYCAEATPSVQSFQVLAQAETNNSLSSAVKATATQDITTSYSSTSSLTILQSALQSSTAPVQLVATTQVDTIVKTALTGVSSPTGNPSAQGGSSISATEIQQLLAVIQKLMSSSNSALSAEAQTAATDLQSLQAQSGGSTSPVASTP